MDTDNPIDPLAVREVIDFAERITLQLSHHLPFDTRHNEMDLRARAEAFNAISGVAFHSSWERTR